MKVQSKLIVIGVAVICAFSAAASLSRLPTRDVWLRNVSGLIPVSIGSRCCSKSAARYGISAGRGACSSSNPGVDGSGKNLV
jgi:hypothetical protein